PWPRKVASPLSAEMPAPVSTATRWARRKSRAARSSAMSRWSLSMAWCTRFSSSRGLPPFSRYEPARPSTSIFPCNSPPRGVFRGTAGAMDGAGAILGECEQNSGTKPPDRQGPESIGIRASILRPGTAHGEISPLRIRDDDGAAGAVLLHDLGPRRGAYGPGGETGGEAVDRASCDTAQGPSERRDAGHAARGTAGHARRFSRHAAGPGGR